MKDWILKHKKLYFFIVGVIAFIAFMAITLHGVKRASAATDSVWFSVDGNAIPDITALDWSEYAEYFEEKYGYTGNIGEKILRDHQHFVVVVNEYYWPNEVPWIYFLFTNEPYEYEPNDLNCIFPNFDTSFAFQLIDGEISFPRGYGMNPWTSASSYGYSDNVFPFYVTSANGTYVVMASSYSLGENLYNHPSYTLVDYPFIADYIFDLDYTFDDVYYRQSLSIDNEPLWTLYFDREPDIVYPSLQNYYIDVSYRFVLPSLDLLQDFADMGLEVWSDDAVDLWRFSGNYKRTYDYQASYLAPQGSITLDDLLTNLRDDWQSFYGTALDEELLYLAVRYAYPQVTAITYREIGTDGNFHMGQTAVLQSYEYYSKLWNGLTTPSVLKNVAVNTHGVSLDYIIPLADVNAKNDYDELLNQYQQEVDKNKEFEQALKDAQSEVERAEEALKKAHEDMGLSGFLGVFDTISKGFEAASDAVTNVASAIGNVFSFLPSEITACLYFVFVFLLFVAIYHGLKG